MNHGNWVWMPHPAHLIVSRDCRFHLATNVGKYIVSTVGEYLPDGPIRELLAESRGIRIEGRGDARLADYMKKIGFEELGANRLYETMVFKSAPSQEDCCPFELVSGEVDSGGYTTAGEAYLGHMGLCRKWSKRK
jgi:hypothetical protein